MNRFRLGIPIAFPTEMRRLTFLIILAFHVPVLGVPLDIDFCTRTVRILSPDRERLIEEYSQRIVTSPEQNEAWLEAASQTFPDGKTLFYTIENGNLKTLNKRDKVFATSLTNKHQALDTQEVEISLKGLRSVEALPYSGFKTVSYAFRPKGKKKFIDKADLNGRLQSAYRATQAQYRYDLTNQKIIREEDGNPSLWFRAGTGDTADRAAITARVAEHFNEPNRLFDFNDSDVQIYLSDLLKSIHEEEKELQESLKGSPFLMELPNSFGRTALRPDIFDKYRKYPDASLKNILEKKYKYILTDDQILLIQSYIRNVDTFSPAILIKTREIPSLRGSKFGGISIDSVGQGGINLYDTAQALSISMDVPRALHNVRVNEVATSREFTHKINRMKSAIESAIRSVRHRRGFKGIIKNSGDDMNFFPLEPLTADVVREIGRELTALVVPSSIRLAYALPDESADLDYDELVNRGEDLEKLTREKLEETQALPQEVLDNVLLMVEVGASKQGLIVASQQKLSLEDKKKITQAFKDIQK